MLEAKNRNAGGQGHRRKCSPKKRSSQRFFKRSQKKGLQQFFSSDLQWRKTKKDLANFPRRFGVFKHNFNGSKTNASIRGQVIFEDLKLRGRGLDLRGQGQGL